MINNKKAMTVMNITLLIISIFTMLILMYIGNGMIKDSNYKNSLVECSYFFNNIKGQKVFFDNLESSNNNLINSLSNICPSKTQIIDEKKINLASDLISDCYLKSGKGTDILPSKMGDDGICLYCGNIKTGNSIENFNQKLSTQLNNKKYISLFEKNSDTINFNSVTLNETNLPSKINLDEGASVFYYIFKPQTSTTDKIQSWFSTQFTNFNFYDKIENSLISSDVKTYSGVLVTTQKEYQGGELLNLDRNSLSQKSCTIIVPKKNYN